MLEIWHRVSIPTAADKKYSRILSNTLGERACSNIEIHLICCKALRVHWDYTEGIPKVSTESTHRKYTFEDFPFESLNAVFGYLKINWPLNSGTLSPTRVRVLKCSPIVALRASGPSASLESRVSNCPLQGHHRHRHRQRTVHNVLMIRVL